MTHDDLGTPIRIYLRDAVDHEPCANCGAEKGELCAAAPEIKPMLLFTHVERTAARRTNMTSEDYTELAKKFEAWDKRMGEIYGT
jgi:hypothetical protein